MKMALVYNWPPNSWDSVSVARMLRLFQAQEELADERAANVPTDD